MSSALAALVPPTLASRLFLGMTFIEAVVDVVIEAILLEKGQFVHTVTDGDKTEHNALPVYLGIFAAAHVFQLVLAAEAIWTRNFIQILGLGVFNLLFLVWSIIQIGEVKQAFADPLGRVDGTITGLLTVIPIVISLTSLTYCLLTWQLYKEFGWSIFKSLGADRRLRRIYLAWQIFVCSLKFDAFVFLAWSLQFILLVLSADDIERVLTIVATPVIMLILLGGYFAVRREHRLGTAAFLVFQIGAVAYLVFKLLRIYVGSQVAAYMPVRKSLTVFSILALGLVALTFAVTAVCYRNFDRGLRYHFRAAGKRNIATARPKADEAGYPPDDWSSAGLSYKLESAAGSRLSID